jgi:L-cysteine:1D-myo-inositol 2-amino-2-deoxy-alpha-D-glucopyranoside ligase
MRSWPAPSVPTDLVGRFGAAPEPLLYDTARSAPAEFQPAGPLRLYVCGITPYDATHVGHAATYVAFDLAARGWLDAGRDLHYVQNVTDVDDPLLERATLTGQDWAELAAEETAKFADDMASLHVLPPTEFVGAVESIPLVTELIARLGERGALYEVDGDWYFPVAAEPSFGAVSRLTRAAMVELFGERGGDPNRAGKKDPLDCLVWKCERPGEPAWDSPLGRGRPGWHVECAAISAAHLGLPLHVQGGGRDLVFPHHEMCAAVAQVATGQATFAASYVHAGMVGLDGEKMSKSRGNLVFVSELRRQGHDPTAIRLALLAQHYRNDWDWTVEGLADAEARLDRWRRAVSRAATPGAGRLVTDVRAALADDLDTPAALQLVDAWAGQALAGGGNDRTAASSVRALCDARLGLRL